MKLKDGKSLSHLEIIKRLNLMGIDYNPDIIGKKYFIDLYNKAIQSPINREKIKLDIKKDQMYIDFYNEKLQKRKAISFEINEPNNIYINNMKNDYYKYNCNIRNICEKKPFFGEFNGALVNNIVISHLCFTGYDYAKNNINTIENIYKKIMFPIHAINKYSMINVYPEIKRSIMEIINKIENLVIDKYSYIAYLIYIILLYAMLHFIFKRRKK